MVLLAWMATGYKYVDYTTGEGVVRDENDDNRLQKTNDDIDANKEKSNTKYD